jgi:hypothetical protein
MKRIALTIVFALALGASAAHAQAPVADYFSTGSKMDGATLAAGTTIEAIDSDGIICGSALANADGSFLIHVYGNDSLTPSIDEGANQGETLKWRLDGNDVLGADATWIANIVGSFSDMRWENGAAKQIDLQTRTSAVQGASWSAVKDQYRR